MPALNLEGRFVALNGAMASGKTTQAKILSERTGASLLLGEESKHPSIASGEVYTQGSNVDAEKWFVDFHVGKLATFQSIPEQGLVADMSVQNDLVWGRALLEGADLQDFESYYDCAAEDVAKPDVAYLFLLPPPELLRRVRQRMLEEPNRTFEANTKVAFIDRIQSAFIEHADMLGDTVHLVDLCEEPYTTVQAVHDIIAQRLTAD